MNAWTMLVTFTLLLLLPLLEARDVAPDPDLRLMARYRAAYYNRMHLAESSSETALEHLVHAAHLKPWRHISWLNLAILELEGLKRSGANGRQADHYLLSTAGRSFKRFCDASNESSSFESSRDAFEARAFTQEWCPMYFGSAALGSTRRIRLFTRRFVETAELLGDGGAWGKQARRPGGHGDGTFIGQSRHAVGYDSRVFALASGVQNVPALASSALHLFRYIATQMLPLPSAIMDDDGDGDGGEAGVETCANNIHEDGHHGSEWRIADDWLAEADVVIADHTTSGDFLPRRSERTGTTSPVVVRVLHPGSGNDADGPGSMSTLLVELKAASMHAGSGMVYIEKGEGGGVLFTGQHETMEGQAEKGHTWLRAIAMAASLAPGDNREASSNQARLAGTLALLGFGDLSLGLRSQQPPLLPVTTASESSPSPPASPPQQHRGAPYVFAAMNPYLEIEYFHWVVEALPRLAVIQQALSAPSATLETSTTTAVGLEALRRAVGNGGDKSSSPGLLFLLPNNPWVLESCALLGIRKDQIIHPPPPSSGEHTGGHDTTWVRMAAERGRDTGMTGKSQRQQVPPWVRYQMHLRNVLGIRTIDGGRARLQLRNLLLVDFRRNGPVECPRYRNRDDVSGKGRWPMPRQCWRSWQPYMVGGQSYPVDVSAMIPAPAALQQVRHKLSFNGKKLTTDTQLHGQQAKEEEQQQRQRRHWRVIYVSRNTGAAKCARQVDGEAALLQELQQELVRWTGAGGIKSSVVGGGGGGLPAAAAYHQLLRPIIELEVFTADRGVRLADTARRFADDATQVIMGPSGAGLANMLFSRPGVDVLVFPIRAQRLWGDLALKLGHQVHHVGALTTANISSIYIADKQAASGVAAKLCEVLTKRLEESQ